MNGNRTATFDFMKRDMGEQNKLDVKVVQSGACLTADTRIMRYRLQICWTKLARCH